MSDSDTVKGVLAALLSALALSTMGIMGKMLFRLGVDPMNAVMLRAILAFLTLGLMLRLVRGCLPQLQRQDIPLFLLLGLVGIALNYSTFFLSLDLTSVSTAIVLLYTYPFFVVLGAALFLGESLTFPKSIALLFSFIGCILITKAYQPEVLKLNFVGVFLGFVASLTKAVYTLMSKNALAKYDPWTTVFYAFGFGALFLMIFVIPMGKADLSLPLKGWGFILAIAWLPTLIGYSLFVVALRYLEAGRASLIATLEPVLAMVLAYLILKESLDFAQILGTASILVGIFVLNMSYKKVDQRA